MVALRKAGRFYRDGGAVGKPKDTRPGIQKSLALTAIWLCPTLTHEMLSGVGQLLAYILRHLPCGLAA